jgi:ketosteroid isomerase-like protein
MSRENVEIVRRIYDAVARRDTKTPFEIYAEDIVWDLSGTARGALAAGPRIATGHEGVRQAWREGLAAFGEVDYEVAELFDVGDKVFVEVRDHVVGRSSGAPGQSTHYAVWTLADGKVTRLQVFDDRADALQAAGLGE